MAAVMTQYWYTYYLMQDRFALFSLILYNWWEKVLNIFFSQAKIFSVCGYGAQATYLHHAIAIGQN